MAADGAAALPLTCIALLNETSRPCAVKAGRATHLSARQSCVDASAHKLDPSGIALVLVMRHT
jgi:hypothetical protein